MPGEIYAHFAAAYGGVSQPVVIADERLNTVYYNPCAAQNARFVMTDDFLRKLLSPQQRRKLWQARKDHRSLTFFVTFGTDRTRFSVELRFDKAYLVFLFTAVPCDEQKEQREKDFYLAPYTALQSKPLHRLLMAGELLEQMPQTAENGTVMLRDVALALGITRAMSFIYNEPKCAVVDAKTYLTLLHRRLAGFLQENLGFTLRLGKLPEQMPLKCDVRAFRGSLVSLIKYAVRHGMDSMTLTAGKQKSSVFVILQNTAADHYGGLFLPVESVSTCADTDYMTAKHQLDRQQFFVAAQHGNDRAFRFFCRQTCAETEVVLKETVSDLMEEMLDVNQIEFSDLLYKE